LGAKLGGGAFGDVKETDVLGFAVPFGALRYVRSYRNGCRVT